MSRLHIAVVFFFITLALAQRLVEPAYFGYAIAFVLLASWRASAPHALTWLIHPSPWWLPFALWLPFIVIASTSHSPNVRDVLRDVGAVSAFFVGRHLFLTESTPIRSLLKALSDVGVIVTGFTIAAATLAYFAGVGAYVWRGEFIPPSHAWIPYLMVVNYGLIKISPQESQKYMNRLGGCIVGTLASLSRTDLVLETLFLLTLFSRELPALLKKKSTRIRLIYALSIAVLLLPPFFGLSVVQERINVGVDDGDQSVGWRLIENAAFLAMMQDANLLQTLFGFGLGARIPLPQGIVDFNDNTAIPHLHNSFLTIFTKLGAAGLLLLLAYTARMFIRSKRNLNQDMKIIRSIGRWIILFVLLKAITLQGLTEWSHVLFFGLGCAFVCFSKPKLSAMRPKHSSQLKVES